MPGKGLPVSTKAIYVVKILIKLVLEAVRLKNSDKMTPKLVLNPLYSPFGAIWQAKGEKLLKIGYNMV